MTKKIWIDGALVIPTTLERFNAKVEKVPGVDCWLWIGALKDNGYGDFWFNEKVIGAHRASYLMFKGEVASGHEICHRCDVRCCVNPDHLFTGSRSDNMQDASRKGRMGHRHAKLTNEEVREIRASGKRAPELARRYGVPAAIINGVLRRQFYKKEFVFATKGRD